MLSKPVASEMILVGHMVISKLFNHKWPSRTIQTGTNGALKENSFHQREIIHFSEQPSAVLSELSSLRHRLQGRSIRADLKKVEDK